MIALKTSLSRAGAALLLAFTASGAVATACSSDNSAPTNNPPDIGDDSGAGGSGGKPQTKPDASAGGEVNGETGGTAGTGAGGSGNVDTEGGAPDSGAGGAGGEGGDSGSGGAGGADECDPSKTGSHPKACYPCAPTKSDQFLNHCTTSDCQPFDNVARLGAANWNDGKLIPLP